MGLAGWRLARRWLVGWLAPGWLLAGSWLAGLASLGFINYCCWLLLVAPGCCGLVGGLLITAVEAQGGPLQCQKYHQFYKETEANPNARCVASLLAGSF